MDSKFGPIYATLVLAYLEEKMNSLTKILIQIEENISKQFQRFLDDCFLIFTQSAE